LIDFVNEWSAAAQRVRGEVEASFERKSASDQRLDGADMFTAATGTRWSRREGLAAGLPDPQAIDGIRAS